MPISAKRFGIGSASFQVHDLTFSIPASPRKNGMVMESWKANLKIESEEELIDRKMKRFSGELEPAVRSETV